MCVCVFSEGRSKGEGRGEGNLGVSIWSQGPSTGTLFTFQTEEEAAQSIKEKISISCPPSHGHDVHVTRDLVRVCEEVGVRELGEADGQWCEGPWAKGRSQPRVSTLARKARVSYLDFLGETQSLQV